MSIKRT